MPATVLITEPIGRPGLELLEQSCACVMPRDESGGPDFERCRELLPEVEAVIVRLFPITGADISCATRLHVVAKHGVGVDNIDRDAATARGIPVLWTPGANANAVVEHTLALMLSLARRLDDASFAVKGGRPYQREEFIGAELAGKTLGVIGLGRIGSRVAKKAAIGLDMQVLAYDPYIERREYAFRVRFTDSLERLLARSDYVSLHVPLTHETRDMIDADAIARMKPGARLINTARGAVLDEVALAEALAETRIAGAGVDVFETEPLPTVSPLASAPNVVLTPHVAGSTHEAFDAVSMRTARGVLEILEGRAAPEGDLANPDVIY